MGQWGIILLNLMHMVETLFTSFLDFLCWLPYFLGKLILIFWNSWSSSFQLYIFSIDYRSRLSLYLKTQSKEYWEDVPTKRDFRDLFKGFSLKKAKIRIFLEILFCSIFLGIMYNIGYFSP